MNMQLRRTFTLQTFAITILKKTAFKQRRKIITKSYRSATLLKDILKINLPQWVQLTLK